MPIREEGAGEEPVESVRSVAEDEVVDEVESELIEDIEDNYDFGEPDK